MRVRCDEVFPGRECAYVAQGESAEAVRDDILHHERDVHADVLLTEVTDAHGAQEQQELNEIIMRKIAQVN